MMGDEKLVAKIQEDINAKYKASLPKKKSNAIKINTVLNDEKSSAKSIYDFMSSSLGVDWWELEFETIEQLLWLNYGVALEEINRDKLWAIRHVCRSDRAFHDWFEFNQVALSFSGAIADFDQVRSPSPGMTINAVKTLNHIRPDRELFFSNDVLKYICIIFKEDGLYVPPPSISNLIKETMSKMISPSTKARWNKVRERYSDIINKKNKDMKESFIDIQAKRLVKAEAAAVRLG